MLSVCMIVKNEESVLNRCLDCVTFADEIVIVDTGSTDRTKEIGLKFTDKVYDFEWVDDFSKARNFSFDKASGDYVMWLDADDVIPEKTQHYIKNIDLTADVYMMPYQVGFDRDGNNTLCYYRERILKKGFKWKEPVHECIELSGSINYLDVPIIHCPGVKPVSKRNLEIYRNMEKKGVHFSSRSLYYYARELKDHGLYCESIKRYLEFLNREDGWVEDRISTCYNLSEIYVQRKQRSDALSVLTHSFMYDLPRPEGCCRIADIYCDLKDFDKAIFWYELALKSPVPKNGFVNQDYISFLPHIQLCVCYHSVGHIKKSIYHNNEAGKTKPQNDSYLFNKDYFEKYKR